MKRILVISPHPDDEAIGCGGTIRKHAVEGDQVRVIFLTSGEKGGHGRSEEQTIKLRERESKAAQRILGIQKIDFYHEPDGAIGAGVDLVTRLAQTLRTWRPQVLYVPHKQEMHPDHRAAARLVRAAVNKCPRPRPIVLMYEVWTPLGRMDQIVDITPFVKLKRRAIRAYRSQCAVMDFDAAILGLNRYRGEMLCWPEGQYAEVFATLEMGMTPLASIIIDNFNYGHFIDQAIDSALAQTYANKEIIVVDDGSTDNSRDVINKYGDRVKSVFKQNGGQSSALNAGFAVSKGDAVFFLDADDILFPDAVANAVREFESAAPRVSKVQWPLWIVNENGKRRGDTKPPRPPPQGDFRDTILNGGPTSCISSPTSANAWARWFLQSVMPIPEDVAYYRKCADEFLYTLAPVFGPVRTITEPQGLYRIHGQNVYSSLNFEQKMQLELDGHEQQCQALAKVLQRHGIEVDLNQWRHQSWFHRLKWTIEELRKLMPANGELVLIDDDTLEARQALAPLRVRLFNQHDGDYWGAPPDDDAAIAELHRVRASGATHLAVAWPALWWLEHYVRLFNELESTARCVLRDQRMIVFDLRSPTGV